MTDIYTTLKSIKTPLVLYGTGNGADKLLDKLTACGIKVSGVFVSSGFVRDRFFRGMRVRSFEDCLTLYPDMTVLMCFGSSNPQVKENVLSIMRQSRVLYPEMPVYGCNVFDAAFYESNKERAEQVYSYLADDISRRTFDGIRDFRLTGELSYLFGCECSVLPDDFYREINNALYYDFGAYNGDTVLRFAEKALSYSHITAVEPDKKNFEKLKRNTENLKNITCLNAAVSRCDGIAAFNAVTGRGGHLGGGEDGVLCVTADTLTSETPPSGALYIKADVEGEELNVIKGAEKTIKSRLPYMRIACYHRSEDLFTVPLAVKSIEPSYKVYLRHFPSIPSWDTEYFFVPQK